MEGDFVETVIDPGLSYEKAHGPRLQGMAQYLTDKGGIIAACDDPFGIAQELGHHQAEAQLTYTRWQASQADGAAKDVTNEWLFQTAVAAQSLRELIRQGVAHSNDQMIEQQAWMAEHPASPYYPPDPRYYADMKRRAAEWEERKRRLGEAAQKRSKTAGDEEFNRYFNSKAAADIIAAQGTAYDKSTAKLAHLGIDQVAWLESYSLKQVVKRYSTKDSLIGQIGGGAALSMQLAHCMAGCDTNSTGQEWINKLDTLGDDLLAKVVSFNNESVKQALKEMADQAQVQSIPSAERAPDWVDKLASKVRFGASRFNLGDKALAFAADGFFKPFCESAVMRKMAWPLHIGSLMSVKMIKGLQGLPVAEAEKWLLKHTAITGLSTMGSRAEGYAKELVAARDRKAAALAGKKLARATRTAHVGHAVPEARAAGLAALFDMSLAILKGYQLKANPTDGRTQKEMVGNVLQSIGSMSDFRAKVYEETIFKGVKSTDLYKSKAYIEAADDISKLTLKGLRVTALWFLAPAATVSMWYDANDAWDSVQRGNKVLAVAQIASVVGTGFTVLGSGAAILSLSETALMISGAAWGTISAALGLVGGVLILVAAAGMIVFYVKPWKAWLQDNPLNKERSDKKPIHADLKETMQKLGNAIESTGAPEPQGAPG